jgi:hypothetical protein
MAVESVKAVENSIGYLLTLEDLKLKKKYYEDWAKVQEWKRIIELQRLELDKWYKQQITAIRNYIAKIAGDKLTLEKLKLLRPLSLPGYILPYLIRKADSLDEALLILQFFGLPIEPKPEDNTDGDLPKMPWKGPIF